tara:strand:- start:91 stop:666 length:576 start_codon:yes stop_codon:yes gene_type:complete
MFALKKKYFLIIENTKDIDLSNIKKKNKFVIIYRNLESKESISNLINFRRLCKLKLIEFYIANNAKLAIMTKSDGLYLSSYNKDLKYLNFRHPNFKIIGSAHNHFEIISKIKQKCSYVLLSKLFFVSYSLKSPYLDVVKFNRYTLKFKMNLIPLGGIQMKNLNKLQMVSCSGFALLSEIKKKPVEIINRLF